MDGHTRNTGMRRMVCGCQRKRDSFNLGWHFANPLQLAHYLATKPLFGPYGLNLRIGTESQETVQAACSIGKIIKLLGAFTWDKSSIHTEAYNLGVMLVERGFVTTKSLAAELSSMEVPKDCVEFIQYLLTPDPRERPTAEQALKHPCLLDSTY